MSKKKYLVDVSWTVAASIYVEADDRDGAEDLASGVNPKDFENAEEVDGTFEVESINLVDYPIKAEVYDGNWN